MGEAITFIGSDRSVYVHPSPVTAEPVTRFFVVDYPVTHIGNISVSLWGVSIFPLVCQSIIFTALVNVGIKRVEQLTILCFSNLNKVPYFARFFVAGLAVVESLI